MKINKSLNIDLNIISPQKHIRIHEGDVDSVDILIGVTVDDESVDLTGVTIKYDATINNYLAEQDADGSVVDDKISIPVTQNMTAMSGLLLIDVRMIQNDQILFTQTICATVEKAVVNGSTYIDFDKITIIQRMNALEEKMDYIEELVENFDTSKLIVSTERPPMGAPVEVDVDLLRVGDTWILSGYNIVYKLVKAQYNYQPTPNAEPYHRFIWQPLNERFGVGNAEPPTSVTYQPVVYTINEVQWSWLPVPEYFKGDHYQMQIGVDDPTYYICKSASMPSTGVCTYTWREEGGGASSGITIINTETVPESAEWGDSIPASYAGNTRKAGEIAYWEEDGYFWGLCSLAEDPWTGNINYNWVRQADEIDISDLKTEKMSRAPLNPTAQEIEAMPSGQLYGDTVNHKGVIKDGQSFYDTDYIDEAIPTKVSDLTNDSGFIDIDQMKDAIISKANAPIIKHESLTPSSTETAKLFNFSDGTAHDWSNSAAYSVFTVQGGELYLISGNTPTNTEAYSLMGFFDDQGNLLETFGKDSNTSYDDYPVTAPTGAVTVIVNSNIATLHPIFCYNAEYDSDCIQDMSQTISEMSQTIIDNKADIDNEINSLEPAIDRSDNIFYFTDTTSRTVNGLTLEFLSKSSVKINGTCTAYQYIGIMGGEGDKKGVVVNSKESYSGTFSLRLVESGGTGAVLRYGAAGAAGTAIANNGTVTLNDQYFSFRIVPNKTYTDYIVEIMLTPTEEPEEFCPYNEVLGAVDHVARNDIAQIDLSEYAKKSELPTADHFVNLCNQVQPKKIVTWIDDDTASATSIQSAIDIADELGIRCSFASITGNWTTAIVDKLKEAQNRGFHIFSHGHSSHSFWRDTSKTLLDLDGDLALSLSELRQNGFVDSDMIAYPGGTVSARPDITKIARKWCRCGVQDYVAAGGKYCTGYGQGRYRINRLIIDKSKHADAAYYTDALDLFSDNDAPWFLLGTHSNQTETTFDADLFKAILQYAMNNGWTIMTLNEAFHYRERYYQIQEMFGLN